MSIDPIRAAMEEARRRRASRAAKKKVRARSAPKPKTPRAAKWTGAIWITILSELDHSLFSRTATTLGDNARYVAQAVVTRLRLLYPSFTRTDEEVAILLHRIDEIWPTVAARKDQISVATLVRLDDAITDRLQPFFHSWNDQSATVLGKHLTVEAAQHHDEPE